MRVLALDYGQRRVGLALCDPEGILAWPLPSITWERADDLFARILAVVSAEGVEAVVVGLPLSLQGEDTLTTRQTRNFAARLGRRLSVPIHLFDERLSSAAAEEELKEAGLGWKKRKKALDSQAAVKILESYLRAAPGS
jgi:putative Holliday junction resolvase